MQVEIDRAMARVDFDVVLVEGSMMWRFGYGSRTPVVLDEHNVEYEILERTYVAERSPVRKLYAYLEYVKFKREELAAWRGATRCVFTSERERNIMLGERMSTPAVAIPNGVDLDHLGPGEDDVDPSSVLFTGRIAYRPNTDAVLYFVRKILPIIHRSRPDVVLTVAGADVPPDVRRLAGPNVVVTGPVPDMRPYWRRAAAVVVPLRFGGGTRIKVLEALAMARPVVSTSLGCEGIDVVPGDHLLMADEPEWFAQSVLRVLGDPELGANLGRRGRMLVEARYAWSRLSEQLETVLCDSSRPRTASPQPGARLGLR
jgi:glycosyltransferase involved in cell wall biosynthesis